MVLKSYSGIKGFVIVISGRKLIRAMRHGTLEPGRRSFRPLQITRQSQILTTLRYITVPGIFLIREKSIKLPLHLL